MKTKISALIIFVILIFPAMIRAQDLNLEIRPGKVAYRAGDTVVVGARVVIPKGYHLYGNPLGPGIGKPLNFFVNKIAPPGQSIKNDGIGVAWIEARKSAPKKYTPPIGDWVWAYESEAYFFVNGIAAGDSGSDRSVRYEVMIEALICKSSCIPVEKRIAFDLVISSGIENTKGEIFSLAPNWRTRYAKAEPMEFKADAPCVSRIGIGVDDGNASQAGIKLDLGGLSGLSTEPSTVGLSTSEETGQNGQAAKKISVDNDADIVWDYAPVDDKREYGLFTAILFALIAGLAMNLTPCIFPVLGVRVLSFAESARESRRTAVVRSVFFGGGIVSVFLLLAAFAAFAGFSWGQQFQNPAIMVVIIGIVFLFALGMFDFYTITVPSAIGNAERQAGSAFAGDFLKGMAATVMATPCGGPFLGALLAWALLQPPGVIFALFSVMGVGMAIPYVLLSSSRKLMKLLPRPGRWIEDFKYAMGFVLLVFAVLLMKSLDPRLTVTAAGIALSILCAASVNKRFSPFGASGMRRIVVGLVSVAMLAAGTAVSVKYLKIDLPMPDDDHVVKANSIITAESDDQTSVSAIWYDFCPQALRAAHEQGRSVVVNFTASWCTNCKLNKSMVLNAQAVRQFYVDKNIVLLTADITNPHPQAESLLHHLGSRSVPFLAIFPADSPKNPVVMRDIISKDKYLAVLRGLP